LRAGAFLAAAGPRTRAIVINSPCNPTGALMPEDEMIELADFAAGRGIWVVLDLCYEKLIYEPTPHNLPKSSPIACATDGAHRLGVEGLRDDRLAVRLGGRAGAARSPPCNAHPEPLDIERLLDHAESGARRADRAAGLRDHDARRVPAAARPRDRPLHREPAHPLRVAEAGAFYVFPDVSGLLSPDGLRTSADLAQALLDDVRVALTPGEAFDAPGFVRMSYATSVERLEEAARRIEHFVQALDRGDRAVTRG
jgi:aspartate aminotransferase